MIIVSFIPFLILGYDSYFIIHDNLDCLYVPLKIISKPDIIFNNKHIVKEIMNGIPREVLPSGLNLVSTLFYFFGDFYAYIINLIAVRIIAFWGMYFLLSEIDPSGKRSIFHSILAMIYGLLPFYSIFGISIAGLPVLFLAVLYALRNKRIIFAYLIFLIFPLYSNFTLIGVFILGIYFVFIVYQFMIKKVNKNTFCDLKHLICGFIVMLVIYCFAEKSFFISIIGSEYVSHRFSWNELTSLNNQNAYNALTSIVKMFFSGFYHSSNPILPFALFSVLLFPIILLKKNISSEKKNYIILLLLSLLFSIIYGLYSFKGFYWIKNIFPVLRYSNFGRFYMFNAFIYFMMFYFGAIIMYRLSKRLHYISIFVISIFLIFQCKYAIAADGFQNEIYNNWKLLLLKCVKTQNNSSIITYNKYFDNKLFDTVKNTIGYNDQDKSISVGIYPSVALANGINTADAYLPNYPLEYKNDFYEIISNELKKDKNLESYYVNWGSRCYAFSSQLGKKFNYGKNTPKPDSIKLDYDWQQAKKMGIRFIFSAVKIDNDGSLKYSGYFYTDESYWEIWVYEIK